MCIYLDLGMETNFACANLKMICDRNMIDWAVVMEKGRNITTAEMLYIMHEQQIRGFLKNDEDYTKRWVVWSEKWPSS